jgi:hypothetical protein
MALQRFLFVGCCLIWPASCALDASGTGVAPSEAGPLAAPNNAAAVDASEDAGSPDQGLPQISDAAASSNGPPAGPGAGEGAAAQHAVGGSEGGPVANPAGDGPDDGAAGPGNAPMSDEHDAGGGRCAGPQHPCPGHMGS